MRAGAPADEAEFRTATRDDVTTQLGEYVAFVTPSGKTRCMTGELSDGALACLVTLADPPPQPDEVYGEWVPGWVEFDGTEVTMGAGRADPGQFSAGTGAELPYGSTLKFGDYQCRSDQAGVFCINFAHQSGVRISDTGVEPFGCLRKDDTPPDAAARYSCR
ncbi:hypothetical protein MCNF_23730 [Mycolicibacterium confluentis]|uniref:Lipoprotein LppI n=1 Tax=Mycolicibacterium confluentis TaxID=28047 RepID=A0A7I7XWU7_9MYCO|nr:hypothetical protein MCNF_23730 [Mycolicibacterium confluentis]